MAYDPNPARTQDNYLVCSAYEERINTSAHARHEDVIAFQHSNGLFYFAILEEGSRNLALRSEGYPTTSARDVGLKSVLRFREKRARYKIEEQRGMYFTCLTAQNSQEIARSCPKRTKAEAMTLWPAMSAASQALASRAAAETAEVEAANKAKADALAAEEAAATKPYASNTERTQDNYLVCSAYHDRVADSRHPRHEDVVTFMHSNQLYYFATLTDKGEVALRSEGYPSSGARDTGLKSVLRFREKRQRFKTQVNRGFHFTVLYAQNGQEIARSCPQRSAEGAAGLMPGASAASAALAAAAAAPVVAPDAEPTPMATPPADESTVASPISLVPQEDTTDEPVDRSPEATPMSTPPTDESRVVSPVAALQAPEEPSPPIEQDSGSGVAVAGAGLAAAAALSASEKGTGADEPPSIEPRAPKVEVPQDPEDDYLACKEYRGRSINDRVNRVSLFKHENGQYYFAIINPDSPEVRLRSEGFRTAKERDQELRGALRFIDDESKYERIERNNYYINVLHDETGREVGRSCARKESVPFLPVAGLAAAAAVPVVAATPIAAAATSTPPPPVVPPVKKAVIIEDPVATVPPAADKGGCAWWMWLLAGLLLLGLLWFFLRGCGDATATRDVAAVSAPDASAAAAVTPEVESTEPAYAPPLVDTLASTVEERTTPIAAARRPLATSSTEGLECGSISVEATYNDNGIPLLPVSNFSGLAGDVQDLIARGGGTQSFSLGIVAFLQDDSALAIEPCSVGDVDRLAAVMRDHPNAVINISATTKRDCRTLARLLRYRGVDEGQMSINPSPANEITITP